MHVRFLGVLAVVGVGITVGCGGGKNGAPSDGDGSFVSPTDGYQAPPGSYDTPGSSVDQPPADDDAPPGGFETPPGGGSSGGSASTGRACDRLCSSLLINGCSNTGVPADQAECVAACGDGLEEAYPVCLEEVLTALDCIFRSPSFDCGLFEEGEVDEGAFEECAVDALRYTECIDRNGGPGEEPGPDPEPGDECTLEGDECVACETACEQCECQLDVGAAECVQLCSM